MKKLILMTAVLLSLFVISASAQSKVRVNFGKNQYEKTVSGTVSEGKYIDYVFRVKQYLFIEVQFKSGNKNLRFSVLNAKGNPLAEGVKVRDFSGEAEKTGDYIVRVYGNGSSSKFRLRIAAFMGT